MSVDAVTIFVSVTAAIVVGTLLAKMVTKVVKVLLVVAFVVLLAAQLHYRPVDLCAPIQSVLGDSVTIPFCQK